MQCDPEKLASLVMKTPAIYDLSLKDHSNRQFLERTWENIAKEMNCSAFECKAKWGNLRSAYSRYIREGQTTMRGKRRKKWYLAESMNFLEKYMLQQKAYASNSANIKPVLQRKPIPVTDTNLENNIDLAPSHNDVIDDTDSLDTQSSQKSSVPKKTGTKSSLETTVDSLIELLRTNPTLTKTEDDADTMFFKSVLADYKNLTKKRKRYFRELMVTTMNKLQEEDENDEMQPHSCQCSKDNTLDIKCDHLLNLVNLNQQTD